MSDSNVVEMFGSMVFNDHVMRQRLPKETYRALKKTVTDGVSLDISVARTVAACMKDWAIEKGATHYTHWFQPMTGVTAEKHDSFISPTADGHVIMEFSGKELIKGEPDASSFPSGGLRATFEARGYTAWDPSSYAFVKENTLYIPTVFYSYGGQILDKKTPLLRSMEAIDRQAMRIVKLFGHRNPVYANVSHVQTTVGAEQEYFLVDKAYYNQRKDLKFTGRTLIGAMPPKGQELDDHYFGAIRPRVKEFMKDLDEELWKLGICAKTEHNEVAPAQHELAPIYDTTNIATDHNQLTMDMMKRVADRHGLVCLLHEKPFKGVNGSGKHNNWSICTDTGFNLLNPGASPRENAQFLLFLLAVVKGVNDYQDLLRLSAADAGNDHRLGASEAPPAIVSISLGDELTRVLEQIDAGEEENEAGQPVKPVMEVGVDMLPKLPKDTTDRNRTSPFAFTGNKFEFRMVGSSASISCPNVMLNTIVAESLSLFADELEQADDFQKALHKLIKRTIRENKRIIYNGNNYSEEWVKEAEGRGLLNLTNAVDALSHYADEKNIKLFAKHKIYTEAEVRSRMQILLESYVKTVHIEALTLLDMIKKEIIPSVLKYLKDVSQTMAAKESLAGNYNCLLESTLLTRASDLGGTLYQCTEALEAIVGDSPSREDVLTAARYYRDKVIPGMDALRAVADELEMVIGRSYWPFPTYNDLLFGV